MEGVAEVLLLGSRSGSGVSGGRGGDPLAVTPPLRILGCLVALLLALGSVLGALLRCSLPSLPGPDRLSRSQTNGASWSPSSRGRCSQPCMPLATETHSACDSLRMPGRVRYDPQLVGATLLPLGGLCARTGSNWRLPSPSPGCTRMTAPHAWGRALPWTHVACLAHAEKREPPVWPLAVHLVDSSAGRRQPTSRCHWSAQTACHRTAALQKLQKEHPLLL